MADEKIEVNTKYTFSVGMGSPSLVIRVNHGKELRNAVDAIKEDFEYAKQQFEDKPKENPTFVPSKPQQPQTVQQFEQVCGDCGAKKIMSKAGSLYCSDKCWLKK